MKLALIIGMTLSTTIAVGAEVYKCEKAGVTAYQDIPCQSGEQSVVTIREGQPSGAVGLRDSERNFLAERAAMRAAKRVEEEQKARRREVLKIEREKVRAQEKTARAIEKLTNPPITTNRY